MIRRKARLSILLSLLAFLAAGLAVWAGGGALHRAGEAALLLAELAGGPEPGPFAALTPAPSREPFTIPAPLGGAPLAADLYRPARAARAALVLLPGAAPAGREDARLVALAEALARAGIIVLVPEIKGWRRLRFSPADPAAIAAALAALGTLDGLERDAPRGLGAISYAVGPALIAVLESPAPPDFLVGLGGFYRLEDVLAHVAGARDARFAWLFMRNNLDVMESRFDAMALAAVVERRLADPAAAIDDLAASLGREGRAALALAENRDAGAVAGLVAALPGPLKARLRALDPAARDIAPLATRLILIHGTDDPALPLSGSEALAAAAPAGLARLYAVEGLAHVEPGAGLDGWALWRALCRLLAERDGAL
jgi:hypothetical protein